jgi:ribonuclease P protein component
VASNPRLPVLKRRSDFLNLAKKGQRIRLTDWLILNFMKNPEGEMRCGWTLPRQVGGAVVRNRLKRWSRQYFRNLISSGREAPVDVNLVFRRMEPGFFKKLDYGSFAAILDQGWLKLQKRAQNAPSVGDRGLPNDRNNPSGRRVPV